MTVLPYAPRKSTLMLCTPESGFQLNVGDIKERSVNNQHQHNCFEFTYVLNGSMYQIVEGARYYYPTGSCCLMDRNMLHTEEISSEFTCLFLSLSAGLTRQMLQSAGSMLFSGEQLIFENEIFRFMRDSLDLKEITRKGFLDFVPKITHTEQISIVHQVFEDILQSLLAPEDGATFRVLGLLMKLTSILCAEKYYNVECIQARSNTESMLLSRIDRILNERHGRITHTELAKILNYNGSYLGRIVKKHTGQSLFEYSTNFAMEYAAKQLQETDRNIADIAAELKFSNRSHFYKLFKNRFGVTPMKYRERMG
jgi:AraC-like DNA-binding protein